MKNKIANKIIEPIDFKGFYLFKSLRIQKINDVLKDRKRRLQFSQQPVDQITQQAVAQLKVVHFTRILWSQNVSLESPFSFEHQIYCYAATSIKY